MEWHSDLQVKYSPWLPEASIAALLLHTVYILVVPEQSKDEEASQACGQQVSVVLWS